MSEPPLARRRRCGQAGLGWLGGRQGDMDGVDPGACVRTTCAAAHDKGVVCTWLDRCIILRCMRDGES